MPIVLDHVGGPSGLGRYAGKRDEVFAAWRANINDLAACPNMFIKLGGLGMRVFGFDVHEGVDPPGSATLATLWRPYIETCIAAFGAERSMFESNFPVDEGSGSYQVFWSEKPEHHRWRRERSIIHLEPKRRAPGQAAIGSPERL